MWKGVTYFIMVSLICVSLVGEAFGDQNGEEIIDEQILEPFSTKEWTFMVYLDSDNNLEYQGINDFLEMAQIGSDSNVNIVVQMDRIDWWDHYYHYIDLGYSSSEAIAYANGVDDTRYGDWDTTKRFHLSKDETPTSANAISDLGEMDMGDPDTLYDFINWTLDEYPANRYALVLWDHGGQWDGVCYDDTDSGSKLNMSELDLVFWNLSKYESHTFDIIGFDACLMASIEVACQMWGYTDYMIASELVVPGNGWIYNWSLDSLTKTPKMSTENFCRIIVDDFTESYETIYSSQMWDTTMSVINFTADFYSGIYAIYNFTYELYNNYSLYQNYLNYAWGVRENYSENYCDMIDLFVTTTYTANNTDLNLLYQRMIENLTEIYCYQNFSDADGDYYPYYATGLSIYFPTYSNYDVDYTADKYFYFPQNTYWPYLLWEAYLQDANTDPVIKKENPTVSTVNIFELDEIEFNVSATDSDGNHLRYYWFIDDEYVWEGHNITLITDLNSYGSYTIDCIVFDGAYDGITYGLTGYDIASWTLNVREDNIPPFFSNIALPTEVVQTWQIINVDVGENHRVESVFLEVDLDFGIPEKNHSMEYDPINENYRLQVWLYDFHLNDPGWHNITFSACDPAGNWGSLKDVPFYITDIGIPFAETGVDLEISQHETVYFDGSMSYDNWKIVNYTWNFSNRMEEITLYGEKPEYTFDDAGFYRIILNVTDPDGNWDTDLINVTVLDITDPVAHAGEDLIINQFDEVQFDGCESSDNVGIVSYYWYFEYDGTQNDFDEVSFNFTFIHSGEYYITLVVKDLAGNENTTSIKITVKDITPPTIIINDIEIDQHTEVHFDGSKSSDNVGIINYTWNFFYEGVNVILYGVDSYFTFDIAGIFVVTLELYDENDNSNRSSFNITVNDITPPKANITIQRDDKYPGPIRFSASNSYDNVGIVNYTWKISIDDDIWYFYGTEGEFEIEDPGTYTISLVIFDSEKNSDSLEITLEVISIPIDPEEKDSDNDGHKDIEDEFPEDPTAWQDTDGDGKPDELSGPSTLVEDDDDDNDGILDVDDAFPKDPAASFDTDGDGKPDELSGASVLIEDDDDDNDGVLDVDDAFPKDPAASKDSDGDGYPDEWNPGMGQEDSTTGLELDIDFLENEEKESSILLIIVVVILLILLFSVIAFFIIAYFVKTSRRSDDFVLVEKDKTPGPNKEIESKEEIEIKVPRPPPPLK